MHDIRAIRENPAAFQAALDRRGLSGISTTILKLDEARRSKILASETAQALQTPPRKRPASPRGAAMRPNSTACAALSPRRKPKPPPSPWKPISSTANCATS